MPSTKPFYVHRESSPDEGFDDRGEAVGRAYALADEETTEVFQTGGGAPTDDDKPTDLLLARYEKRDEPIIPPEPAVSPQAAKGVTEPGPDDA